MQQDAHHIARRFAQLSPSARRAFLDKLRASAISFAALPIVRTDRTELLPLSPAQRSLWITWKLDPNSSAYNMPGTLHFNGTVDEPAIRASLNALIERHETLRTTFPADDGGEPRQSIHPSTSFELQYIDLRAIAQAQRPTQARRLTQEFAAAPFQLDVALPVRALLLRTGEQSSTLVLTLHHIVADDASVRILCDELLVFYAAFNEARTPQLASLPIQFADYAVWQHNWFDAGERERQLDHWRVRLGSEHPVLDLPLDRPRPSLHDGAEVVHPLRLPASLQRALRTMANGRRASLYMALLAVLKLTLYRYSGQRDLRVGSPVTNRQRVETHGLIGYLTNLQVLRTCVDARRGFDVLLEQVRDTVVDAQDAVDVPFDLLVEALQPPRQAGVHPLFQVKCTQFEELPNERTVAGCRVRFEALSESHAHFDLSVDFAEVAGGVQCVFRGAAALFDEPTIARFANVFLHLAQQAVRDPGCALDGFELPQPLSILERPTVASAAPDVIGQWTRAVCRGPQQAAVRAGAVVYSYAELDAHAGRLAARLRNLGVGPETRVGLYADRSAEFVLGVLAVLKAGGAYVPLDPQLPPERLSYQLTDSGAQLLLAAATPSWPVAVQTVTLGFDAEQSACPLDPPAATQAAQAAYVIYTSGSTGKPKGVVVSRDALANYVESVLRALDLPDEARNFAMVSTVAADLGHTTFFGALCSGRTLHLIDADCAFDPDRFASYMKEQSIDVLKIVPGHLQALLHAEDAAAVLPAHTVIVGGEATDWPLLERIRALKPACRVVNHYGPSETTVGALTQQADTAYRGAATLPIGATLAHADAMVLDASLNPVPRGVAGELYLGGEGLARGYQGRPGQSAERFVAHPRGAGGRLYRTGDRVRQLPDGALEFLGRSDDQVKIRGYRVELAEVRAVLHACVGVADAAVVVAQAADVRTQLHAYVVPLPGRPYDAELLRAELAKSLPDYMMPAALVCVDALPLTPNGKLDRNALPAPVPASPEAAQDARGAPDNPAEGILAAVWVEVLRAAKVGRHDNFFELGGDSILALQIVARCRKRGLKISPRQLMGQQTIARIVETMEAAPGDQHAGVSAVTSIGADVPLTPVQRWFFAQPLTQRNHWNQSVLLAIDEPLDEARLRAALQRLVACHHALRLQFVESDDGWRQRVRAHADEAWRFSRVDLSDEDDPHAAFERAANAAQCSLDLSNGPVFHVLWAEHARLLLLIGHHLVVDAVSWRVLIDDLQHLYEGGAIDAVNTTFPQWAALLHQYADSDDLRRELPYWSADVADTRWPVADSGGVGTVDTFNTVDTEQIAHAVIDATTTSHLLRNCAGAYRTRTEELLLCALTRCLCEWTALDSVRIELEGHGREDLFDDVDLSRTVGWFTTLFPVRLTSHTELAAAILAVKEQMRRVPHRGLGYGVLRYLGAHADQLERAQPYATFNYLGGADAYEARAWRVANGSHGTARDPRGTRRAWFEIIVGIVDGQLAIDWHYSERLHDASTVQALLDRFADHLRDIVRHCMSEGVGKLSPADFPLASLSEAQLDGMGLDASNVSDIYPLAPMQQGLLLHTLLNPGAGMYHMQDRYRFAADIDIPAFIRAWDNVVERHDILRTGFIWQSQGAPVQVLHRTVPSAVQTFDWSGLDDAEAARRLDEMLDRELAEGFDFMRPPLLRLRLIRLGERDFMFVESFHHILMDAWCRSLLFMDFFSFYDAYRQGRTMSPPQPRPYRDFITWLSRQDHAGAADYWRDRLKGFDVATPLPWRKRMPDAAAGATRVEDVLDTLTEADTATLQRFARAQQLTIGTLVQGAWALLLSRLGDTDDVLFGVTVAGRPVDLDGIQDTVGLFINSIPLRVRMPSPHAALLPWLRELLAQNLTMRQHEHLPLVEIQALGEMRAGRALFDSLLVVENAPVDASLSRREDEFGIEIGSNRTHTNYPITLVVMPGERLGLQLSFDLRQFERDDMTRLLEGVRHILLQLATHADRLMHQIEVLPAGTMDQLLSDCAGPDTRYPFERGYADLFEEQARRVPLHVAVRCGDATLSYDALNRIGNRIGHALRANGVREDDLVVLYSARGASLAGAVLGTFKAGAAYLALDVKQPLARVAAVLGTSKARVVVAEAGHVEALAELMANRADPPRVLCYDALLEPVYPDHDLGVRVHPDQAAYVIYTSGSTGEPKGVVVTQRGMLNNQLSKVTSLALNEDDVIAQTASQSFDISVWQLLTAWLCGASVNIVDDEVARKPVALLEHLAGCGATVWQAVPAMLQAVLASPPVALPALRWMLPTGEASTTELARQWFERYPQVPLVNAYGPAECADDVSLHRLDAPVGEAGAVLPIGRPVVNTSLFVLDGQLDLLPRGVTGELYVAGTGVAQGYLNRAGLSAERFVPHPLSNVPGARLYRTGDLARYREDGVLEYVGRIDQQVKLHGFRIELGEIEAQLARLAIVREAAAGVSEGARGARRLVGYVVLQDDISGETGASGAAGDAAEDSWRDALRVQLGGVVPDYMVPSAWVRLERLPLTPNGKLDRNALAALAVESECAAVYQAPHGELEDTIARLWIELLAVERVGREDNFFMLGGNSLSAMQAIGRLEGMLRISIPFGALFDAPTLRGFAGVLASLTPHGGDDALRSVDAFIDSLEEA